MLEDALCPLIQPGLGEIVRNAEIGRSFLDCIGFIEMSLECAKALESCF